MKKFVGSFVGVAGVSSFIVLQGIAQANINSGSSNSSSQFILSQNSPGTTSPSTPTPPSPRTTSSPGGTSSPGTTSPNRSLTAADKQFITKAAQSDQTEIQTSQLALKRSQNQEVRSFAERMIQEHTTSSQQLTPIAQKKGFTPPKDIGKENKALLTKLSNLKGTDFDRAYMQGQVQAHSKTLANYQNYLKQGQDPDLTAFASQFAPIVADHLQMAQSMAKGSGTTGSSGSGHSGSGHSGTGTSGTGTSGSGTSGTGTSGSGTSGTGTSGSGTSGTGTSGSGTSGTGTSGSGTSGTGTSGSGTSGTGTSNPGR
jgi:putative membrane protein